MRSRFIAATDRALALTGKRVSQQLNRDFGLVSPRVMRVAMWTSFAVAALLGLELIRLAGWPVIVVAAFSANDALLEVAVPQNPDPELEALMRRRRDGL